MSSLYGMYKTDKDLESKRGVVLDFGEYGKIRVLRANAKANKNFAKSYKKHTQPYKLQLEKNMIDEEIFIEVLAKVYAESVVIDWEGIKDEDGKDIPFSREAVEKLFVDLPDFLWEVQRESMKIENFQRKEVEQVKKK